MTGRRAPIADPHLLLLNCPRCGQPVRFDRTVGDVHVYHCDRDGVMCLRPVRPAATRRPVASVVGQFENGPA